MPAKSNAQKAPKKATGGGLTISNQELSKLAKSAQADMKKYGFKTVEELTSFYDSKRGY